MTKLFLPLVILIILFSSPIVISAPFAFAQITIADGDVLSIDAGGKFKSIEGAPFIYKINPDTSATISSVEITLDASFSSDLTVIGGTGIDFNQLDGKIYALLKTSTDQEGDEGKDRVLATIDPQTGIATLVGDTEKSKIASLTFNPGTLYSVDLGFEGLSTISTVDGSVVNLCGLVEDDGSGLALNSNDGLLYYVTDDEYQRIDDFSVGLLNPCDVTDISVSGFLSRPTALLFIPTENHFLVVLDKNELHSLSTTSGADLDSIGDLDHNSRGLTMIHDFTPPPDDGVVGGELIPIETTSLLLASAQTFSWMIPVVLSILGIGLFVVSRKSKNS